MQKIEVKINESEYIKSSVNSFRLWCITKLKECDIPINNKGEVDKGNLIKLYDELGIKFIFVDN